MRDEKKNRSARFVVALAHNVGGKVLTNAACVIRVPVRRLYV